jgi:hypothetical protein
MEIKRIRVRIAQIAASPKNVRFKEVSDILDKHIGQHFDNYSHRQNGTHHAFTLGIVSFSIAEPHGGGCVKKPYVRQFLDAMEELDFYRPEEAE